MKVGVFSKATLVLSYSGNDREILDLHNASFTAHPSQMAEVTHYVQGKKEPHMKRTLVFPLSIMLSFKGEGYAT